MKTIHFDMDGTIADLYGYENWLEMIKAEDIEPYECAKPLVNMSALARMIHSLERDGFKFGIISWTAKGGSREYNKAIAKAKMEWLAKHLPSVDFEQIIITDYGTPKTFFGDDYDILVDDDESNRIGWEEYFECGMTIDETDIIGTLKTLKKMIHTTYHYIEV